MRRTGLLVRAPNHLGDLVMALPALEAAGACDVQVVRGLAPLLAMAALPGRVLPLDRGARGLLRSAAGLRRGRYARGVLLTPSFSSALLLALGGVGERRGTATDRRAPLLTDAVDPVRLRGLHRTAQYVALVTGSAPADRPAPRLAVPEDARARWRATVGAGEGPWVGVFPGSNAPSRRWEPARFAEVARRVAATGARVVVFGGPAERALTAEVAGDAALDMGGRTDLALLAAGLAECDLLVTNDSGPMHLAAAVGTPTISLWGAGDPAVTGPPAGHSLIRHAELACVPCVKNRCPRKGRGDILPEAHMECLRLIGTDAVVAAAEARLAGGRGAGR